MISISCFAFVYFYLRRHGLGLREVLLGVSQSGVDDSGATQATPLVCDSDASATPIPFASISPATSHFVSTLPLHAYIL